MWCSPRSIGISISAHLTAGVRCAYRSGAINRAPEMFSGRLLPRFTIYEEVPVMAVQDLRQRSRQGTLGFRSAASLCGVMMRASVVD